jgi:hypothetical protein
VAFGRTAAGSGGGFEQPQPASTGGAAIIERPTPTITRSAVFTAWFRMNISSKQSGRFGYGAESKAGTTSLLQKSAVFLH